MNLEYLKFSRLKCKKKKKKFHNILFFFLDAPDTTTVGTIIKAPCFTHHFYVVKIQHYHLGQNFSLYLFLPFKQTLIYLMPEESWNS